MLALIVALLMTEAGQTILTPRWFPLPEIVRSHGVQQQLFSDLDNAVHQFTCIAAGRRSFKTERFVKRRYVRLGISTPGEVMGIGGPTYGQVKLIFWDDLKALVPAWALKDKSDSELWLKFHNDSILRVIGLKEYSRIEGARWTRFAITEYQKCPQEFFPQTLQPILNDTHGEGILEGRPLGRNHFYTDCNRAKTEPKRWGFYTWKSSEILSAQQIEDAKADLAIEDYLREYDASFDADSQRVYYAYSGVNNKKIPYDPNKPIIVTCDFNAQEKPMSWVIGQQKGNDMYWRKVLQFTYTNTEIMCVKLDEYLKTLDRYPTVAIFYGDYSGQKHTSNSSFSDWEIITSNFRNKFHRLEKRIKPCLDIRDRNAATNAQLCNTLGVRRMFIDPDECKPLVLDWEMVQRKENGIDLDGSNPMRTHTSDAVDYWSDYEHPIKQHYGTLVA